MATFNKVEKGLADQIAVLKELGDTPKYTAISPTSIELMAASKFIGRECSVVNAHYIACKANKTHDGQDPTVCAKHISKVQTCTQKVVAVMNSNFTKDYVDFQTCLDKNDYRFSDCRKTEKSLIDAWNSAPADKRPQGIEVLEK